MFPEGGSHAAPHHPRLLHRRNRGLLLALPAAAERVSSPDPAHALEGAALVHALRGGGFTLYFRHTATDFSQNDRGMTAYDECATQRNLSEAGRGAGPRASARRSARSGCPWAR